MKKVFKGFVKRLSFLCLVIYYKLFKRRLNPLYALGVHFIGGSAGAGKTLLSSLIINQFCDNKLGAFCWANIDQYDKKNTKVFEFSDIFKGGQMVKRLDGNGCQAVVVDEANLFFNRRINNRTSYNDLFLGLQQLIVTHRHLNLKRVYLIGQHVDLQDIQLQKDFKYMHYVSNKKAYSYKIYKDTKKMKTRPMKLYIKSFLRDEKERLIPLKKQKIKITWDQLNRYNTHGFFDKFKDLPVLK